jgi:hypothetical protein
VWVNLGAVASHPAVVINQRHGGGLSAMICLVRIMPSKSARALAMPDKRENSVLTEISQKGE